MKRALVLIWRAVPFVLLAAIILATVFYPTARVQQGAGEDACVVTVWNVDTFEGGKGSRTSFLQRVARLAEHGNTYYRVLSYTAEGAQAAMQEGDYPDILSFGIGLEVDRERCIALGGTFAGSALALPWCRGRYLLFSLSDDFEEAGNTAISAGGCNLAGAAAYFAGIEGEERESLAAYLAFLNGEFRYLLGTQRDENRFAARGATVYTKALPEYCDLYQYICVFSQALREECMDFVGRLLSEDVQGALSDIGMLPAAGAQGKTIDIFSSAQTLENAAGAVRPGSAEKNPEKYFKSI